MLVSEWRRKFVCSSIFFLRCEFQIRFRFSLFHTTSNSYKINETFICFVCVLISFDNCNVYIVICFPQYFELICFLGSLTSAMFLLLSVARPNRQLVSICFGVRVSHMVAGDNVHWIISLLVGISSFSRSFIFVLWRLALVVNAWMED